MRNNDYFSIYFLKRCILTQLSIYYLNYQYTFRTSWIIWDLGDEIMLYSIYILKKLFHLHYFEIIKLQKHFFNFFINIYTLKFYYHFSFVFLAEILAIHFSAIRHLLNWNKITQWSYINPMLLFSLARENLSLSFNSSQDFYHLVVSRESQAEDGRKEKKKD